MLNAMRLATKVKKGFTRQSFFKKNLVGFTLIELLIVITLFGLSTSMITASYLTFEKNQRVKTAALNLKNDLRLAQNYALSGYKGVGSDLCSDTQQLIGWYIKLTNDASAYHIAGACIPGSGQIIIQDKIVTLPKGVTIASYQVGSGGIINTPNADFFVLFQPLRNAPSFHNSPIFTDVNFVLTNLIGSQPQHQMVITLSGNGGQYQVNVNGDSGEIGASKI